MAARKRIRHTPADARRLIVDAAQASMATKGPAGIRLQDVARAAGVSHSNVLHHFGSRAGLIEALHRCALDDLRSLLLDTIRSLPSSTEDIIRPVFAAYRDGLAQRALWAMQASASLTSHAAAMFEDIVEALHARRVSAASAGLRVDKAHTRTLVHLTTIVAFGDALIGARLRQCSKADEPAARRRFERWFAALLDALPESHTTAGAKP